METQFEEENERQREIVVSRNYYDGEHGVTLPERLREFIPSVAQGVPFRVNASRKVVTAVVERLRILGFDSTDETYLKWITSITRMLKFDALQSDIHEAAIRDGESFIIVDWDTIKNQPRWTMHDRYTSVAVGGNGTGCWMVFPENDYLRDPKMAVKQWSDYDAQGTLREYRTVYYPDHVEYYVRSDKGDWVSLKDPQQLIDADGKPFGIPVIAFQNKGLQCETLDVLPLQDGVNKTLIDLLMTSDLAAFRIYVALGWWPTTDGKEPQEDKSNWLPITPGSIVGTTKAPSDASFTAIEPTELAPLLDTTQQLLMWLAMISDTPLSRFISTKLIASDETLKQQEEPLVSKVEDRRGRLGKSWKSVLEMTAKFTNAFGTEKIVVPDEEAQIIWVNSRAHSETELLENATVKAALGVPQEQLWTEIGYDKAKIAEMKKMRDEETQNAIRRQQSIVDASGGNTTGNDATGNQTTDNQTTQGNNA